MKMNVLIKSLVFLPGFLFFMSSVFSQQFQSTDSGLRFLFYRQNFANPKPATSNMLYLDLIYTTENDSILYNSHEATSPFVIPLMESEYPGDIYEGLAMMALGDSACFVIAADSFFLITAAAENLPEMVRPSSFLKFYVRLYKIAGSEEYENEQTQKKRDELYKTASLLFKEKLDLQEFIEKNFIRTKPTQSGLYYIEMFKGTGPRVQTGDTVSVHYFAKFLNGVIFDSSYETGEPFEFVIGNNEVIAGWEEALQLMNEGGKAIIIIPSKLGYGERGVSKIPPCTPLIFDLDLLEIR